MSADTSGAGPMVVDDGFTDSEEIVDDHSKMSFLEHLDELRRRILYSLYVLIACCAVTFYFWDPLFRYFVHYFQQYGGKLIYTAPMAGFMFSMKVSALAALIIASPFIFSQIWLFIAPGLYAKEKRVVVPFVFFASIFFFAGGYFAHRVAFPAMWKFFASYELEGLGFMPNLDVVFGMYVKTILGVGLVFQMPMLVFFLARFGIVSAKLMLRYFKYAVLAIIIIAAIITPTQDPVTLAIFAGPMLMLYVLSIGVAWLFGKKRPKEV